MIDEINQDTNNTLQFKLNRQCTWNQIYQNIVITKDVERINIIMDLFSKVKKMETVPPKQTSKKKSV